MMKLRLEPEGDGKTGDNCRFRVGRSGDLNEGKKEVVPGLDGLEGDVSGAGLAIEDVGSRTAAQKPLQVKLKQKPQYEWSWWIGRHVLEGREEEKRGLSDRMSFPANGLTGDAFRACITKCPIPNAYAVIEEGMGLSIEITSYNPTTELLPPG